MSRSFSGEIPETKKKRISYTGLREATRLYHFIKPYRLRYMFGIFFLFGSSSLTLVFPKLLGELVKYGSKGQLEERINYIALLLGLLLLLQSLFSYFRTVLFVQVTERSLADLRRFTYDHLIHLPIYFFEQHRVGELNSRISADIALLQETLTSTLAEFIRQLIIIIGGISLLLFTSIELTLFMLAVLPATVLLAGVFGRFIRGYAKKTQSEVAVSNAIVEETLQGIRSVKAFTNEFFEMGRYRDKVEEIARIAIKGGVYRGAFASFIIGGLFGALVAVVWRGALLLSRGELDPGQLFSFILYSGFIAGTIGGIANVFTRIQHFLGATEDLFALFDSKKEDLHARENNGEDQNQNKQNRTEVAAFAGAIRFQNLTFSYPSRPESSVLENINLSVSPDQMVALVGASGAGKSTIASLLLRLYDPPRGQIFFDDRDCLDIPLSDLRRHIALVPQDIYLFGGTIRENIAYGRIGASETEIRQAAEHANAWEFVERLEKGLDTVVGERGLQLSGGQRQRISIARALLKNPRILILDEATSALDSESEQLVQEALTRLMRGRTTLVIAHRLSTIRKADQIFVFDKGHLIEKGSHSALLSLENGIYRRLSGLQGIYEISL